MPNKIKLQCTCCGRELSNVQHFVETREVGYSITTGVNEYLIKIEPRENSDNHFICNSCFIKMFSDYVEKIKQEDN